MARSTTLEIIVSAIDKASGVLNGVGGTFTTFVGSGADLGDIFLKFTSGEVHIHHRAQGSQGGNIFSENNLQLSIPPPASPGCWCRRRKSSHRSSTPRTMIRKNSGFRNIKG